MTHAIVVAATAAAHDALGGAVALYLCAPVRVCVSSGVEGGRVKKMALCSIKRSGTPLAR